jgi:hypothetical protein
MPIMEAYQETVEPIRDFSHGMHNTQEGDPRKAASAIQAALRDPATPLRLQLGADAINAVRTHSEMLLAEMERWEKVGLDTRMVEEIRRGAGDSPGTE